MRDWTDLPPSWTVASLDCLAEINPRSLDARPEIDSALVHFVPMRAVNEEFGGIDVSACRPFGEVRKGYTSFQEGDALFAKITPCMENGKLALVPKLDNGIGFGSTEFHVLRARSNVAPKWLAYFLSQAEFRKFARRHMTGTAGQLRVTTPWLAAIRLPTAPSEEQTRIVDKLEELLSDLDAGVAELKAAQKKLARYRQSLLKAAVEGRLTETWRAQHGNTSASEESGAQLLTRILRERRARWEAKQLAKFEAQGKAPLKGWQEKYPEPVALDTQERKELPHGWVWANLAMLSEIQGGIQKQPSRAPVLNKYPFLRVANVARAELKLEDVHEIELFAGELERLALERGDVLIVEGNGSLTEIGRCALWDGSIKNTVHQNHLIRARPISMSSDFLAAWLNSLGGIDILTKMAATTSGLYTLSVGKLSKVPVPLPPIDEQVAAVNLLSVALEEQMRQDAAIKTALRQSAAQRKSILQAAFSGQLVPQDPNDEPASVLLARIQAERATPGPARLREPRASPAMT